VRWVEYKGRRVRWAEYQADWRKIADWILRAAEAGDPVGFDSEFEGEDLRTHSPVGNVRIQVWSLALLTNQVTARGHRRAVGFTLPEAALHDVHIRGVLEDPDVIKVAHNAPVDIHATGNSKVRARGVVNSLSAARFVLPGRVEGDGFGLKSMMPLVGRHPVGEFKELFTLRELLEIAHRKTRKVCTCGVQGCKKRKGHERILEEWVEYTAVPKEREVPLSEILDVGPRHPLWALLIVYAAEDAEAAVELYLRLMALGQRRTVNNPFL
jgi:hypothetical protein